MKLIELILKGMVGGAFAGLILGFYVTVLTRNYVIQQSHYQTVIFFEEGRVRYMQVVMLSIIGILSLIGPFIAAADYGPWLRHAVYGLVGCISLVVGAALLGTIIRKEHFVYHSKMAEMTCIDAARLYGLPTAFVLGPIAGVLIGRCREKQYGKKMVP